MFDCDSKSQPSIDCDLIGQDDNVRYEWGKRRRDRNRDVRQKMCRVRQQLKNIKKE